MCRPVRRELGEGERDSAESPWGARRVIGKPKNRCVSVKGSGGPVAWWNGRRGRWLEFGSQNAETVSYCNGNGRWRSVCNGHPDRCWKDFAFLQQITMY